MGSHLPPGGPCRRLSILGSHGDGPPGGNGLLGSHGARMTGAIGVGMVMTLGGMGPAPCPATLLGPEQGGRAPN